MPWKRPASVAVGQVWSRFDGRARGNQPAHKYQIRDMEEKYKQRCLDFMEETFLRDEPLCDILGITKDPLSISTIRSRWENYVAQGVSLACFTETDGEPDELVGFNITVVFCREDHGKMDLEQVQGETWKKLLRTLITAEELVDVFSLYGVDNYLAATGLAVLPEHRGQNIGARMLEARKPLCRAVGIQATATLFTAKASQVLAAKCGYDQLAELRYSDMMSQGIDLSGCATPTAILMGTKFNFE